jgi:hypothetical protein
VASVAPPPSSLCCQADELHLALEDARKTMDYLRKSLQADGKAETGEERTRLPGKTLLHEVEDRRAEMELRHKTLMVRTGARMLTQAESPNARWSCACMYACMCAHVCMYPPWVGGRAQSKHQGLLRTHQLTQARQERMRSHIARLSQLGAGGAALETATRCVRVCTRVTVCLSGYLGFRVCVCLSVCLSVRLSVTGWVRGSQD